MYIDSYADKSNPGRDEPPSERNQLAKNQPELDARIRELESLITRIPRVPIPVPRIQRESFAESPFEKHISMVDMPERFTFPSMRLFDGTSDPDDHIAHFEQRMFTDSIPRE